MRYSRSIVKLLGVTLLMLTIATSCKGPKVIPDNDLINIFHDAYIANAYIDECRIYEDSIKVYEPILQRYGYDIADLHFTLKTFSQRKSAMLSNIMREVGNRLDEESRIEAHKMKVLDTIEHVAQRAFTRIVYSDSLIRVNTLKDTSKLRITIPDIIKAEYTVTFDYLIDTLDENRNSRAELYMLRSDSSQALRHTMMLQRYKEGKYSRKFNADTSHRSLYINIYYHPRNEEAKLPDITIKNLKVKRVLTEEVSVDSLYNKQLDIRIFNTELMTGFTRDTLPALDEVIVTTDSTMLNEPQDSITLHTN